MLPAIDALVVPSVVYAPAVRPVPRSPGALLPALPIPCRPQLGPPRHEALSVHLPRPHTMQARCWQSTRSHAISGRNFSPLRPRPILGVLLTRLRGGLVLYSGGRPFIQAYLQPLALA